MSHSSIFSSALNRVLLRRPLSLPALQCLNSTLAGNPTANSTPTTDVQKWHRELRKKWIPRRREGIARAVFDAINNPGRENRPRPKDLLRLLHGLGVATAVRESVPGKTDLTHCDPLALTWERKQQLRRKVISRHSAGLNLKGIAERFIYHFYYAGQTGPPKASLPDVQRLHMDRLGAVFSPEVLAYLEAQGYKPEDVMAWVWILTARDGVLAVLRLDTWVKVDAIKIEQEVREQVEKVRGEKLVKDWRKRVEEWREREEKESDPWGWNTAMDFFGLKKQDPEVEVADSDTLIASPTAPSMTSDFDTSPTTSDPDTSPVLAAPRIPSFLLLFILRLPNLPSTTLRILLPYIAATLPLTPFHTGDTKTPLVLLIRLLRHARAVYPSALPHIATLITTHLHPASCPPTLSPRLTATYNRLLSLFSHPVLDRPFKSLPLQQRSQFLLLRKMASLGVPITREGYRALTSVQLAHRKTATEASLARSLASTWPPWPIARDGHAASAAAVLLPLSRAAQVLRQMLEAGYAWQGWETEAAVLAGTDTDASPTIQTRTFYHDRRSSAAASPCALWAVRVRATRTVEEAWCVFLAATEARELAPEVWEEMFAKVLSAAKGRALRDTHRKRLERIQKAWQNADKGAGRLKIGRALQRWDQAQRLLVAREKHVLPGDAKEVAVAPISPSDGVYVDLPVPGVEEMFAMMRRVGGGGSRIEVEPRLVAMLVKAAESVEAGEWVMKEWSKEKWRRMVKGAAPSEYVNTVLVDFRPFKKRHFHANPLILTAYLHLLFSHSDSSTDHSAFAVRLLLGHAPPYPPAWNTVIAGLSTSLSSQHLPRHAKRSRATLVWRLYKAMTKLASADAETLRVLCVTAERSLSLHDDASVFWDGCSPVDQVQRIFSRTLELDPELPPLLLPEPATLHAYVRVLGFTARHDEILNLLRWMCRDEAGVDVDAPMTRRVLVAARVFLEDGKTEEAKQIVDRWIGNENTAWPSEDEVEEYCILGGLR
ncbi:hypothetical protein Q9L58_004760 [Maublancomyces gigas]|uniref:Pentatricopeptide repeat protein n=1 Tax=Discina gigas TaxID=1032678 RepID=A0ABR3GKB7_9PEZI